MSLLNSLKLYLFYSIILSEFLLYEARNSELVIKKKTVPYFAANIRKVLPNRVVCKFNNSLKLYPVRDITNFFKSIKKKKIKQ